MANIGGQDVPVIVRTLFVTDKDGVEHQIKSPDDLNAILAQMTPEELELWKARYRFTPIQNKTGIPYYTGTSLDR
jgi:hypothetical protein